MASQRLEEAVMPSGRQELLAGATTTFLQSLECSKDANSMPRFILKDKGREVTLALREVL